MEDVINAAQFGLEPVMKKKLNRETANYLQTSLKLYLRELETLCCDRLFFPTEQVFSSVWKFKEQLTHFLDLIRRDASDVRLYWREFLDEDFKSILKYLLRESEKITNSA